MEDTNEKLNRDECEKLNQEVIQETVREQGVEQGSDLNPEENQEGSKTIEQADGQNTGERTSDLNLKDEQKNEGAIHGGTVIDESPDVKAKKKITKKTISVLIGIVVVIIIVVIVGLVLTSDSRNYADAKSLMEKGEYKEAADKFKELGDYEDSEKLCEEALHKQAIKDDKTTPTIHNVPDSIEIKAGDLINPQEWMIENGISASDDVSSNVVCSVDMSNVDTNKAGTYAMTVSAKDEAGNVKTETVSVIVKKIYTQEEIESAVKSTYLKEIPGLYKIKYDQEEQNVWVFLVIDGMAETCVYAKLYSAVKKEWDGLAESLDEMSGEIWMNVIASGYPDVENVCVALLNDLNVSTKAEESNILYAAANGRKIADVTD